MNGVRRYFIETWGCQMNELDSQRLAGQLTLEGYLPTASPADADIILLNSCSVREKAEQKAYSQLGRYRLLKEQRPHLQIGFCGCVAQQEGETALRRLPEIDFVVGTGRVGELRQVLRRCRQGERVVATGFPAERDFDPDTIDRDGQFKGMITVIEGCDKRCTFCVVPQTRGPERCRPLAEIEAEARHLVASGFREIELLGQTVNHWRQAGAGDGGRDLDFADLLDAIATIDGVERLRFITSYPRDFSDRMIDRVARHRNICPYLHLPVQSGSDRVLQRMGRGYDIASYLRLVEKLRRARADLALSTDIIVGFPGETDEDFAATMELLETVRFASVFAFKYSPRPATAALRLDREVPPEIADQRLQSLFALQNRVQRQLNEELVGLRFEALVTGAGKRPGHFAARTPCHRVVHFADESGSARPGEVVPLEITAAYPHSLVGVLAGERRRLRVLENEPIVRQREAASHV